MCLAPNDPDLRTETLNCDLEDISESAKKWKVKFNEGKTEQQNFTCGLVQNQQLIFGNKTLKDTIHHKHL